MSDKPRYSIITPIKDEQGNITKLYQRIRGVMDTTGEPWELLMVNDGSSDNSLMEMLAVAADDARVRVINFARNFGHQIAVTAGIDYAEGNAVVLIDADLQDPPEVILEMIDRWKAGYEVIYGVRAQRKGEGFFKVASAKLFYRTLYRITDVDIPLDTGDFRLMDEKVVKVLRQMREHNPFLRGMVSWVGFKQTGVKYVRDAREIGKTKYPLRKMIRFAWTAVTSFSYFPLQVMIYVSLVLALLAFATVPIIAVLRITQGEDFFGGQATTVVAVLLMGSAQLFFLFVLGQYVARIYDEVRDRPLYVVSSTHNFEGRPVRGVSPRMDTTDRRDVDDSLIESADDQPEIHDEDIHEVFKMSNG